MGTLLVVLAAGTLIYGNLAALPQNNLKRLLAYSSIAHAGYLLIALASVALAAQHGADAQAAQSPIATIAFYLAAYLMMTLLSFLVMITVANATTGDDISDFNGLAKRSPFLAFGMLASMLSLAGMPFTAGFLGKFFVFELALEQKQYFLAILGAVAVACGFYYYLKVVKAMYFNAPAPIPGAVSSAAPAPIAINGLTRLTILALVIAVFYFGVDAGMALHLTGSKSPTVAAAAAHP